MTPLRCGLSAFLACLVFPLSSPAGPSEPTAGISLPALPPEFVPGLKVGSPAPAFSPAKWLQGSPVAAFEKNKVYLIECWATWCGPCVAAIPHVNALHNKFKDKGLVVIGVNVWESPEEKAVKFLKKKGDGMAYRVVYDGGDDGLVAKNWLNAAGASGIPHAFVVKGNRLLWQGHPGELTEALVGDMLAGRYDPAPSMAAEAKEKDALRSRLKSLRGQFRKSLNEKKLTEAESLVEKLSDTAERLDMGSAAFFRHDATFELHLARGDRNAAAAAVRDFALAGRALPSSVHFQRDSIVRIVTDPRLAGVRDHAFALECADIIAAKPGAATPFDALLRARLLDATGKTPEALTALQTLVSSNPPGLPREAAAALTALKAGKPWPKDRVNPDAKAETPAVPASEKKE